jgi:hypothetical protein
MVQRNANLSFQRQFSNDRPSHEQGMGPHQSNWPSQTIDGTDQEEFQSL